MWTTRCENYGYQALTSWRNGSAPDSRSEGCVFKSRRGHYITYLPSGSSPFLKIHTRIKFLRSSTIRFTCKIQGRRKGWLTVVSDCLYCLMIDEKRTLLCAVEFWCIAEWNWIELLPGESYSNRIVRSVPIFLIFVCQEIFCIASSTT